MAQRVEIEDLLIELELSNQVKQRELAATRDAALVPVHEALSEVLEELVEEREVDMLVERGLLIYVGEEADITPTVIELLNEKLSIVDVVRVRLPLAEDDE